MQIKKIATIHHDYKDKFGIPRQSGLDDIVSRIVLEPDYRKSGILKGIAEFDYLWLIWGFHLTGASDSPTVRPPRLGGNIRVGVFATRSPYRPNPLGLSSVRLLSVEQSANEGEVLIVSGADMIDGTPIYDIKPYIEYSDSHVNVRSGFAEQKFGAKLNVHIPDDQKSILQPDELNRLEKLLSEDPRPAYQDDPERIYGFSFCEKEVRFRVIGDELTVISIE